MIRAYLFSPNRAASVSDQWDFGLLKDLLDSAGLRIVEQGDFLTEDDRAVVVIPARHNTAYFDFINQELRKIRHVVLFLIGDEEADYPVEKIEHPSIHIWVQNPHPGRHDNYHKLGTGYPPQSQALIPKFKPVDKSVDVFFSGQITHKRREQLNDNLVEWQTQGNSADVTATKGFTQGLSHDDYYRRMCQAKLAPAPCGAVIPDSFRLFEALECMCVAIADDQNSQGTVKNYWNWLFGEETPFYKINNTDEWVSRFYEALEDYPANLHRQTAWWLKYKRDFVYKLKEQLNG